MTTPFSFEPPPGGDVTIKSKDGTIFTVHSVLLSLASSVFSGLFSVASKQDTIQLADDGESIALMLAFTYPSSFVTIDSFQALEKSLEMAQKYDVPGILKTLDFIIPHEQKDKNLAHKDPVRVFRLATRHGLRETQTFSAGLIEPKHCDFHDPTQLRKFAQQFPDSAHLIGLVGAQGVRLKIICSVLFCFESGIAPILPRIPRHEDEIMACKTCYDRQRVDKLDCHDYFPSWLPGWSWIAFTELSSKPLADCQEVFKAGVLSRTVGFSGDACVPCLRAARNAGSGQMFNVWANSINEILGGVLGHVDNMGLHAL
ncbi:The BTB (BR-C, ttk and bab)/POZ (Pox virus and Zinc finger) domain [Ceratobasidium sp. AG-Ba]|nr:The BTB (BR-C, ttk and bab)/POZ (Pox virus and Zinc finger) domain [Ceratobasidium sp. AG-Ba]QRW15260.1 The BTB (BR-C, ttk and bab)/POZ (Pox virus and Zinc finger) domain [Ceratobasidium sp. AG-Ba]